jgi:hypothetical protein
VTLILKSATAKINSQDLVRLPQKSVIFFICGVGETPLGTSATNGPIVLAWDDDNENECRAVAGMRIGRGNRSTRKIPATVPLHAPQIPRDLTRDRIWAAAVGSRRLTALVIARRDS